MILSECLQALLIKKMSGNADVKVTGIQLDSRRVQPGDVFVALRGDSSDGHRYINQAVANGAVAVVAEEEVMLEIPLILVPDSRRALAVLSAAMYRYPARELKVIGVTGTNGKTTTTHLIQQLLQFKDRRVGLMGTNGMKVAGHTVNSLFTTPEANELQRNLRMMRDHQCEYAVMEASSIALDRGRTWGCQFHTAVFTNLTQDHLDVHQSMEKYLEAKGLLFSQLGNQYHPHWMNNACAILNQDDEASRYLRRVTAAQVITYGIENPADIRASDIRLTAEGSEFQLHSFKGSVPIRTQLVGKYNVSNLLAAITVVLLEGFSLIEIQQAAQELQGIRGRMERVEHSKPYTVLVDYAHTPDSLEKALATIREFTKGKMICVVGCGGDRDRLKRPIMARISAEHSDISVLTSDNPRSEDPEAILAEMVAGLSSEELERCRVLPSRREAIEQAIQLADPGDVILIAGKGHETYQEIQGVRYPFDDVEVVKEIISSEG